MSAEPTQTPRLDLIRATIEIIAAVAIAMTHVAGAIGAIAVVRRRTGRCD
jgi:hypothetical protein